MPEKTAVKSKWADSRKDCPGSIQVWSHHLSPGILDAWTGVVEVWEQILVSQSFSKLRHIFFRTTDNDENWISTGDKIEQYEDGDKRAHARISPFNLCIKGLWPFSSWKILCIWAGLWQERGSILECSVCGVLLLMQFLCNTPQRNLTSQRPAIPILSQVSL